MNLAHTKYKAVVIGGSAGSFQGIVKILSQLPEDFPLPIIMCLHRLKHVRNGFVEALSIKSIAEVIEPYDKQPIKKGKEVLQSCSTGRKSPFLAGKRTAF